MTVPASFQWGGQGWSWPVSGRFQFGDWPGDEAAVDALLAALRAGGATVGWLPLDGGLVANLPVWENIVLPAAWPRRQQRAQLEQRIAALLGRCERIDGDWLAQSVARLDKVARRRVGWLRQLLLAPAVLVLEPGAWPPEPALQPAVESALAECLLLALGPVPGWDVLACERLPAKESP